MDLPGAGDTVVRELGAPGPGLPSPGLAPAPSHPTLPAPGRSGLGPPRGLFGAQRCGTRQLRGRAPGRPSTGSPLFPGTPREHPAPGSAVTAGPRQGTPGARVDAARCAFAGGVAGPPEQRATSARERGGGRGVVTLRTPIWTCFPPVPDARREKSRLNAAAGAAAGAQSLGPRAAPCAQLGPQAPAAPPCPLSFLRSRCAVTPWYYSRRRD